MAPPPQEVQSVLVLHVPAPSEPHSVTHAPFAEHVVPVGHGSVDEHWRQLPALQAWVVGVPEPHAEQSASREQVAGQSGMHASLEHCWVEVQALANPAVQATQACVVVSQIWCIASQATQSALEEHTTVGTVFVTGHVAAWVWVMHVPAEEHTSPVGHCVLLPQTTQAWLVPHVVRPSEQPAQSTLVEQS